MVQTEIRIDNARSHNLQGVSCRVPLRALTVVSGVSGSGKSTLAFDTLYAEGQRRYVTSLSTYARQFLERLPRPEVDAISNLPPAIAIEQRNRVTGARSTVGTATEILDHLRLLFARVGETVCPDCERPVSPHTVASTVDAIGRGFDGQRVTLAAPLAGLSPQERGSELRARLLREGHTRLLDAEGSLRELADLDDDAFDRLRRQSGLVLDRLAVREGEDRARLAEAVAGAFARSGGRVWVWPRGGEPTELHEGLVCQGCGRRFETPEPSLFSFNSPLGACPTCQGFGRVPGLDLERVVPDPSLSLAGDAIAPFATPTGRSMRRDLLRACRRRGVATDRPWRELDDASRQWVIDGDPGADEDDSLWYGVRGFFDWLEGRRYKVQARMLIARYRRFDPCARCAGARLREAALCVRVGSRHIADVTRMTVSELRAWLDGLELSESARQRLARLWPVMRARVATVERVGLGYLSLDRQVRTLSGGEAQRIQLGTALGGTLTAALYVLDEPTVGLHARDVERLLDVLRSIRDLGNTVVVVEHAPEVVGAADHVIELGPGAGRRGGRLVHEGSVDALRAVADSPTARALRGDRTPAPRRAARRPRHFLRIEGARENNLRDVDVELPLGQLVVFTGVSGAGKSTLVRSVLVGQLTGDPDRGACTRVVGGERLGEVVVVDQSPPTRSPRSNPATVSKAFEGIRKLFASTREAKRLGVGPGWFSFNVAGGRCDRCEGAGEVVIDMQFLDDVRVPCEACGGRRYRPEVLDVRVDGRSIVDVLELTIEEALGVFVGERAITERLDPYARVGLGYLQLGQPLSTLSGGEHQRMRLGRALAEGGRDVLYVLDEPTTGLHPADVEVLMGALDGLVDGGASVYVVEHNLDVVSRADHVVDLGPGGGPDGGRVVAQGTPAELGKARNSLTGAALSEYLRIRAGA
ncbi:MAG: excinuclease ABC subunit UvrA [Myxococcota bacterium]